MKENEQLVEIDLL